MGVTGDGVVQVGGLPPTWGTDAQLAAILALDAALTFYRERLVSTSNRLTPVAKTEAHREVREKFRRDPSVYFLPCTVVKHCPYRSSRCLA